MLYAEINLNSLYIYIFITTVNNIIVTVHRCLYDAEIGFTPTTLNKHNVTFIQLATSNVTATIFPQHLTIILYLYVR